MVEHIPWHLDGRLYLLVAPSVGRSNMAQVAQSVAVVLAVVVVKVLLQGIYLGIGEVMVLNEVTGTQRLCEDGHPATGYALHLGHLFVGEEDATGIDDDGVVAVETLHLIGIDATDFNMAGVVVEHEVSLLSLQGVDDKDARRSHKLAVDSIAAHRQHGQNGHKR